jgi:pimeloyl-ACP methyl ester carboxylesterase
MAGCGRSDKQEITYTNYFYIQMISDFVKDVIGEKTSVIATGLTGSFILSTDSIHTDLFSEIILINPNTIGYLQQIPDKRSKILMRLFSLPVIGKSVYYAATSKSNVEYYLTERCFHNPFHLNAVTTKAYYTAAHIGKGNGKALLGSIEGFYVNTDISKFLKTTTKNITLVVGEYNEKKDDIINGYTRINPNVKVELIHDSKCLPQLENAKELASLLMDCLS